jgi:hypothetical protein
MKAIRIQTPEEFFTNVVKPDYTDFMAKIEDLRLAFHCAISLFHMADWIYETHTAAIDVTFTFKDRRTGTTRREQQHV